MYITRSLQHKFDKIKGTYNLIAVVGARQAGKTTFLKEQIKKLKSAYLLFDDPDVKGLFEEDIKKFEKQYLENSEISVLDEVQYCKDAGIKLKYLAEKGHKLWITSSSEIVLGKEILSYLVGRVSVLRMYPFSLAEFLAAKKQKEAIEAITKRIVWEHALYGGYPKVVLEEDAETKKIILRDLYETMILKDVAKVFSIPNINSLEHFAKYLSLNIGGIISYQTVAKALGISFHTIKKYIAAFEKSYLILDVPPFFTNKLKEIIKQPKIYLLDTGMRNAILGHYPPEIDGKLFENHVASELVKAGFSLKYWRTKSKAEVDFVIETEKGIIPVEVKLNTSSIEKSMRSFIETYKPKQAFVVGYSGAKKEEKIGDCTVVFTDIFGLISQLQKGSSS